MPDTPIDLSEGIQSVRLKVPTAEVPIPPAGFAQLHSPAPGELALRLPDGSVVAIGGGGGGGGVATLLVGPGGLVEAANTAPAIGININAVPGTGIAFTGRLLDQFGDPYPFDVLTLLARDDPPAVPGAGRVVFWLDAQWGLRALTPDGDDFFQIGADGAPQVGVTPLAATINGGGDGRLVADAGGIGLTASNGRVQVDLLGVHVDVTGGALSVVGLPTVDPLVNGRVWLNPITRALTVSAG